MPMSIVVFLTNRSKGPLLGQHRTGQADANFGTLRRTPTPISSRSNREVKKDRKCRCCCDVVGKGDLSGTWDLYWICIGIIWIDFLVGWGATDQYRGFQNRSNLRYNSTCGDDHLFHEPKLNGLRA